MSEKEVQFGDVEFYLCDTLDIYIDNGTSYDNPGDKKVCIDKPDAIDLGKRLLEHFDVLPGKEEMERLVRQEHDRLNFLDREIDSYIRHGDQPPKDWTDERSKVDATIAKLRRLVGEE